MTAKVIPLCKPDKRGLHRVDAVQFPELAAIERASPMMTRGMPLLGRY
jgi:hypothetical protein